MTDVILTCFSCSPVSPCQIWANKYFKNLPVVLNIPGQGGPDFRNKIKTWAKSGDIFTAALNELAPSVLAAPNFEIGRRALVTFSVGWSAAEELLKPKSERDRLDAAIILDGIHTDQLDPFIQFAIRAANMEAFMIMAHSAIIPPFISSTKTNSTIFLAAEENNKKDESKPQTEETPPEYIIKAQLESPITIKSVYGTTTWKEDPFDGWNNRGNLTCLAYKGDTAETHIYISRHVAERCWRWLGEEWS